MQNFREIDMALHTGRHFLQIPGPTNVPDRVLRAMDMPTIDHRGPEFAELGFEVLKACQSVFQTTQPVIDWCHGEGFGDGDCWAKRLRRSGDPDDNTDHAPADRVNNR